MIRSYHPGDKVGGLGRPVAVGVKKNLVFGKSLSIESRLFCFVFFLRFVLFENVGRWVLFLNLSVDGLLNSRLVGGLYV